MKRVVVYIVAVCVFFGLCAFGWYRYRFPYGHRDCQLSCVSMALQAYASEHNGWFPCGGGSPLQSLQQLFDRELSLPYKFAGVTGPVEKVTDRLNSGGLLDETVSSWVYVPQFHEDDPGWLPILWERTPGFAFNGQRTAKGSYAVATVGGSVYQASGDEWTTLMAQLEEFREAVLVDRECCDKQNGKNIGQSPAGDVLKVAPEK